SNTIDFQSILFPVITFPGDVAREEFDVFAGATLAVRSPISGGDGLLPLFKVGAGKLVLSGHNTFFSGMALNEGTLVPGSNTALGSGTLALAGGTLELESSLKGQLLANRFTVTRSSTITRAGTTDFISRNVTFTG